MDHPHKTHEEALRDPAYRSLYMRYVGTLHVLGQAAAFVGTADYESQDMRESIDMAMADAEENHPIRAVAVLHRYDIEPIKQDNRD
jgi:hypothetical protein